jgi:hypothetical protein
MVGRIVANAAASVAAIAGHATRIEKNRRVGAVVGQPGAVPSWWSEATPVHASGARAGELRIGVIGCGGRGTGAIDNSLSINSRVRLVAVAELCDSAREKLWKAMRAAHPGTVASSKNGAFVA